MSMSNATENATLAMHLQGTDPSYRAGATQYLALVTDVGGAPGSATISLGAVADLGALGWLTGAGEVSLTGDLIAYAIGHMEGTTEEAGLSPTGIANAVWAKIIESGFSASDILRLLVAHAGGDADGLESSTPEFMSIDGATVRLAATLSSGARTVTTRDAS